MKKANTPVRAALYCRSAHGGEAGRAACQHQTAAGKAFVAAQPNWMLIEMFVDEGCPALAGQSRPAFERMPRQCRLGKIDVIVTHSAPRFARDSLEGRACIRELQSLGVAVIFQKEQINAMEALWPDISMM